MATAIAAVRRFRRRHTEALVELLPWQVVQAVVADDVVYLPVQACELVQHAGDGCC